MQSRMRTASEQGEQSARVYKQKALFLCSLVHFGSILSAISTEMIRKNNKFFCCCFLSPSIVFHISSFFSHRQPFVRPGTGIFFHSSRASVTNVTNGSINFFCLLFSPNCLLSWVFSRRSETDDAAAVLRRMSSRISTDQLLFKEKSVKRTFWSCHR